MNNNVPQKKATRVKKNTGCILGIKKIMVEEFGISDEEYMNLQFEYGYRFVQSLPNADKELIQKLKYDPNYGFWTWWVNQWTNDDKSILIEKPTYPCYKELKSAMIDCSVLYQRLKFYLRNKTKKI